MDNRLTAAAAAQQEERELYTTLYHVLAASAPDDSWDHGWMEFEIIAADVASFKYTTYRNGEQRFGFAPNQARDDAHVVFLELARRMAAAGHPAWHIARFETTLEGQMRLNFTYPDSGE